MANSTAKTAAGKHGKPYPGFPLTAHKGANQWCKKRLGRVYYFGTLDDPDTALERFQFQWPYILRGDTVPHFDISGGLALRDLVNDFLRFKEEQVNEGELSPRTFRDYHKTCGRLISHFGRERIVDGLSPDDWGKYRSKLSKTLGVVSLRNEITRVISLFKYGFEIHLLEKPMYFGKSFKKPSAKSLRRHRNRGGAKVFTADEIKLILDGCSVHLRAMVLLGINCGLGNTDVASLPQSALDLDSGWLEFARVKTEIPRRIKLWDETVKALKAAISKRPKPADKADAELCFITKQGNRWVRITEKKRKPKEDDKSDEKETETKTPIDAVSARFRLILKDLEINGRRNFYTLRHTFQTVADESKDPVAVSSVMGHSDATMAGNYRHGVSDDRLRAVVDVVHNWLWPPEENAADKVEGGEE